MADLFILLVLVLSFIAMISDIRIQKIPNTIVLKTAAILLSALLVQYIQDSEIKTLFSHLLSFILTLVLLLIPYKLRWIAGGDTKIILALSLGFPVYSTFLWLSLICICGGLFAAITLLFTPKKKYIPYGVAIFGGSFAYAILSIFGG